MLPTAAIRIVVDCRCLGKPISLIIFWLNIFITGRSYWLLRMGWLELLPLLALSWLHVENRGGCDGSDCHV